MQEIEAHQTRVTELGIEGDEVQEELEQVRQRHHELTAQLQQLNHDEKECRQALQQCDRQWQQTHSRWESLCALQARLEGFDEGVRYLLRDKKDERIPDLLCTLAERIQVRPGFERVVEAALAHKLQAVVCEKDEAILLAIERLRERKKGRVSFLPIAATEHPNGRQIPEEVKSLTPVTALIQTDDTLRPLVDRLTYHTYVAASYQQAIELRNQISSGVRLITREGDIIDGDGTVTGGFSQDSQILGRSAEIKQLEYKIKQLDEERKRLENQLQEIRFTSQECSEEKDRLRQQLMELENRQRVIQDERNRVQKRLQQFEQNHRALTEECNGLTVELEQGAEEAEMRRCASMSNGKRQILEQELDSGRADAKTREDLRIRRGKSQ